MQNSQNGSEKFSENPWLPTSLYPRVSMHQSGLHLYVFKPGGGEPLCDIIPLHTCGRFVSLADFCRLTRKHPWTLPPPFTFNLYQSIQPSRNRTKERTAPRIIHARQLLNPSASSFELYLPPPTPPLFSYLNYFSQSSPTTYSNVSRYRHKFRRFVNLENMEDSETQYWQHFLKIIFWCDKIW